jgi:hypothetical protein
MLRFVTKMLHFVVRKLLGSRAAVWRDVLQRVIAIKLVG